MTMANTSAVIETVTLELVPLGIKGIQKGQGRQKNIAVIVPAHVSFFSLVLQGLIKIMCYSNMSSFAAVMA